MRAQTRGLKWLIQTRLAPRTAGPKEARSSSFASYHPHLYGVIKSNWMDACFLNNHFTIGANRHFIALRHLRQT